jgi:two-component SAPR family response regulator
MVLHRKMNLPTLSRILFIVLFISVVPGIGFCQEEDFQSGLFFSSHEVIQDRRTSLKLTPQKPLTFKNGFSIDFDAKFRTGDGHYGYIFRIICNDESNIDFVANLASPSANFWLVYKDRILFTIKWEDIPQGEFNQWINMKFLLDPIKRSLILSLNGKEYGSSEPEIAQLTKFNIIFGACREKKFFSTDVSPMSLKEIKIKDSKDQFIKYWKLSKHKNTVVLDEITHDAAIVENPNWIIDKHVRWRKVKELEMDSIWGITSDMKTGRIFLVDNKALYTINSASYTTDTIYFKKGSPYHALDRQVIFHPASGGIWSYSFYNNEVSKFSFKTNEWSLNQKATKEPDYWHHNKFISPLDGTLVTLFGYGHYSYKSTINRYNDSLNIWLQDDKSNQIQPRYLSSTGFLDNQTVLVFGGYGSKSGRQELSPKFYYDLNTLSLSNFSYKKLWDIEGFDIPLVPCDALVPDLTSGYIYTMMYNRLNYSTSLFLARLNLDKPEIQFFDDSISYKFLDTESWCTLLHNRQTSELIAITQNKKDISFFSIAYPPLLNSEIHQEDYVKNFPLKTISSIFLVVMISGGFFFFFYKNKRKGEKKYKFHEHATIDSIPVLQRKAESAIYFLGGFQIFGKTSNNLTPQLSPTLIHLVVYLLLNSFKNPKGISSGKLDETIWFDKSEESARNNRNVNLRKLRSIFENNIDVKIINENTFWKIIIGENVYCDYLEVQSLLKQAKMQPLRKDEIYKLLGILNFGEFLPNIQSPWCDKFKASFSADLISTLEHLIDLPDNNADFNLRYHLAESILSYDPLNEYAITVKCSSLYKLGKPGLAKTVYDSFCMEYKNILGSVFSTEFNHLIK